ncbi:MAG TPA: hypothetical protein VKV05_12880 [Terriglobales bacterium]|nr:hypothetical protein [Terriglobales bacterium]
MSAKAPSLLVVAGILTGCVVTTIWLVIFALTMYFSFRGPRWILVLSISIVMVLIGLIWSTFYRLTFIRSDVRESDPRIYVTIREPDQATAGGTPFILRNHGGGVAHNVQVEPLTVCRKRVEFPQVSVIPVGESREAMPKIGDENSEPASRHNLFRWMDEDWNTSRGNITAEWSTQVIVTYADYTGTRHIKSTTTLIFYPQQYRLQQKGVALSRDPVCEFRNVEFSLARTKDKNAE